MFYNLQMSRNRLQYVYGVYCTCIRVAHAASKHRNNQIPQQLLPRKRADSPPMRADSPKPRAESPPMRADSSPMRADSDWCACAALGGQELGRDGEVRLSPEQRLRGGRRCGRRCGARPWRGVRQLQQRRSSHRERVFEVQEYCLWCANYTVWGVNYTTWGMNYMAWGVNYTVRV